MKNLPKFFLGLSLTALVVGAVELTRPGGWGLGIPLGAVFLGLFFITRVLQGESARFDADEQARRSATGAPDAHSH